MEDVTRLIKTLTSIRPGAEIGAGDDISGSSYILVMGDTNTKVLDTSILGSRSTRYRF